jgi:hypothetical protein
MWSHQCYKIIGNCRRHSLSRFEQGDNYDADFLQSADISMIEPERKRIQLNGEAEESGSEIHEVFGINRWSAGFVFETRLFFRR